MTEEMLKEILDTLGSIYDMAGANAEMIEAFTRGIQRIETRFNNWMTFISVIQWAAVALAAVAVILVIVKEARNGRT